MRFEPDLRKARREAMLAAAAIFVVAPAYFWWKGFDNIVAGIAITVGTFVILSARAVWILAIRGLDTLTVDDGGVHLSRRRTSMSLRWEEIHRVYRFGETIVFESHAPHRRYYFLLEGHEHHLKDMVATLAASARTTDLRWVDALAELA
jgi:hypothetical protein